MDDDDSDIVFDDEEVEGNKDKKMKFENIFASADEFAALLEEEGSSKYAPGSSNAVANKEKAGKLIFCLLAVCILNKTFCIFRH